jgi:hypothetical protein
MSSKANTSNNETNYLVATTPAKKIQVKANKENFIIPARTNGKVYIPPKLGNTFKYAPLVATTPKNGPHGRGLGKKGGGRRKGRKTQRRRK